MTYFTSAVRESSVGKKCPFGHGFPKNIKSFLANHPTIF